MQKIVVLVVCLTALSACQDYAPREKQASYNPQTGELVPAYPCPDWSKSSVTNYGNENHSNFGCATTNNLAAQLAEPSDLYEGHGTDGPDPEVTAHAVELYRADKIPVALVPQQSTTQ